MSITVKTKYIFIAILTAFLALFFFGWHLGSSRQRNALNSTVDSLKFEINNYKAQLHGKTVYISQVEQELATQRELIKKGELEKAELRTLNIKKVNEIARLNLTIDTLLTRVEHNGNIVSVLTEKIDSLSKQPISVKKNALLLPFSFSKRDAWLDLWGEFNETGDLNVSLEMAVGLDAISGTDKGSTPKLSVITSNPYIHPLTIESYSTSVVRKKRFGIGFQVGYGVTKDGLSPYIGAGLSYNPIRF